MVAVAVADGVFAHAPGFVFQGRDDVGTRGLMLSVQGFDIVDMEHVLVAFRCALGEFGLLAKEKVLGIAKRRGWRSVGGFSQSQWILKPNVWA